MSVKDVLIYTLLSDGLKHVILLNGSTLKGKHHENIPIILTSSNFTFV